MDEVNLRLRLSNREYDYLQGIREQAQCKNLSELIRYALGTFITVMTKEDTGCGIGILVHPNDIAKIKCNYLMIGTDDPFEVPPESK